MSAPENAVRYDEKRHRILETHTKNGDAFQYAGVSLQLALILVGSAETGRFFEERISGKFPFSRVRVTPIRSQG